MIRSLVGPVVAAGFLTACASPPAGSPALPQPSLVSVALRGSQICGPFNTQVDGTFAFVCMPLPTTIASGWELNPDWTTNAQDKLRANQTAIVTLTTTALRRSVPPTAAWSAANTAGRPAVPTAPTRC
jgi:hypothetical protein